MLSTVCYAPDTSENNPSWKSPQQQQKKNVEGLTGYAACTRNLCARMKGFNSRTLDYNDSLLVRSFPRCSLYIVWPL